MTDLVPTRAREVLTVAEVCRRLGEIHRATFYRIPFFRSRKIRIVAGRVGVLASDVELYIHLRKPRSPT